MNYFITGIGTNVGKTVISAIVTEALQADYWKPIQSGTIEGLDSDTIKSLITNAETVIHTEAYLLKQPLSPHFAAKLDGVNITLNSINLPTVKNKNLIIEGAGGLLVPVNDKEYVIDMANKFDCQIVLVISSYLGCINHALLSIDYLIRNKLNLHAIVFNGTFDAEVKEAILNYSKTCKVITVPLLDQLSQQSVLLAAQNIKQHL